MNSFARFTRLVSPFAMAATVLAQSLVVVPSSHASSDAPWNLVFPGISSAHRLQIVIDESKLAGILGRPITAVLLRRDTSRPLALAAASADIVVRMGPAAHESNRVEADFATNLPQGSEVFRGTITAPASPIPGGSPGWSATEVLRIDLSTPHLHTAGPLAIDFEGISDTLADWPVDAASDPTTGIVNLIGNPCGLWGGPDATASVDDSGLVLGRSSRFVLNADPGFPAWLLLGVQRSTPIDLGIVGANGCHLHVDPFVALGTVTAGIVVPNAGFLPGAANQSVRWPAESWLGGASFAAQWAYLEGSGSLAVSNAMAGTLATGFATAGTVALRSRAGEAPHIQHFAVPVLGFEVQ